MDERDERSTLRRDGTRSRFERLKMRKRPAIRRAHPAPLMGCKGDPTLFQLESDRRKSIRTARHNLLDISEFDAGENTDCTSESSPNRKEGRKNIPYRRRTTTTKINENNSRASCIDNDETEVRDKYALFDENRHLPTRLRTMKHRISRLNRCFNSRNEKNSVERHPYSFNVILAMFAFRFMSRSQFHLKYEGSEIPNNDEFHLEQVKVFVYHVVRWMDDNKLIFTQQKNFQSYPHSCNGSNKTPNDSSFRQNKNCLDLSDYVPPNFVQIFLRRLDEAIDLESHYIHAHNRTNIQNNDDGMCVELNNLRFVELEIEKEMLEIDAEHAAKLSTEKLREKMPAGLEYMDRATATDAFYNAVVAMACDSTSEDDVSSSSDATEDTFDVENARATVLQLVNQIQSQLPQQTSDKATQALPQVQQKIMNDLVFLSQNSEPQRSYEISIDLQASISTIGSDDDIDDHCSLIGIERCDSSGNIDPTLNEFSEEISTEVHEEHCRRGEAKQNRLAENNTPDISERSRRTIWRNLFGRRQDIGRKSPYLQFRKADEECSVESSLCVESKYLSYEYIRESHENNNSIEVILKDDFEISTTNDILTKGTSNTDESTALLSNESSALNSTNVLASTKEAMLNQDMKIANFKNISHLNRTESETMDIPFDESMGNAQNDLGDITWSLSPLIDNFSSAQDTTKELAETEAERSRKRGVSTDYYDSNSVLSTRNETILPCTINHKNVGKDRTRDQTEVECESPRTSDYWKSLFTHSFSPTFDESIASAPIYVVDSAGSTLNSESIMKNMDTSKSVHTGASTSVHCESIVKDDPSGRYSIGDYSGYTTASSIEEGIPRDIEGTFVSSEIEVLSDDLGMKCDAYDPFEAARKIPEVFSETDNNVDNIEVTRQSEYHIGDACDAAKYEQPIPSNLTDSAETIYFDAEDIKLGASGNLVHEAIQLSDSFPSLYFSLPSVQYSNE